MVNLDLDAIAHIVKGERLSRHYDGVIHHIETDTRLPFRDNALFIALSGKHYQAADFLEEARKRGARGAIIGLGGHAVMEGLDLIRTADPLRALQALAKFQKTRLAMKTLAVTGSNGKTILKDFLVSLLNEKMTVTSSPGSFNSQVGVALSLLRLNPEAELAVIEAGISQMGEMAYLENMIQPDYGILTNIGMAHFEGFGSRRKIAAEKGILFGNLPSEGWLLVPDDHRLPPSFLAALSCPTYLFETDERLPRMLALSPVRTGLTAVKLHIPERGEEEVLIPLDISWRPVFQTLAAGMCAAYLLGIEAERILAAAATFQPPLNRIEIWKSQHGSIVVNDTYSSDPVSTRSCVQVFGRYPKMRKIFIFGGMKELGSRSDYEHAMIGEEAARQKVDLLVTVGGLPRATAASFRKLRREGRVHQRDDVSGAQAFIQDYAGPNDLVVVKGPREAHFDRITHELKAKLVQTVYYIRLPRIKENLLNFRERIPPHCKLMVMLKAFAYGADAVHIAQFLQNEADFFGVAYTKEAVALRRNGITIPILVQLPLFEDLEDVVNLSLRPVVFDGETVARLAQIAEMRGKTVKIHIKVDTGLGRFGVFPDQVADLARTILRHDCLQIEGVMTHFSAADSPDDDAFSKGQLRAFETALATLQDLRVKPPLIHAAATAATARFPQAHFTMVRLGLGLFGIYPSPAVAAQLTLKCPVALVSKIGRVKHYPKGYPVSYGRKFQTQRASIIGFLPIGYHDGLSRRLSNIGHVLVRGKKAPIVGSVCMDFTAIDLTDIHGAKVGDRALIMGEWGRHALRVEELAALEGTIPYEVLCRLSERIQRIYLQDEPLG